VKRAGLFFLHLHSAVLASILGIQVFVQTSLSSWSSLSDQAP
jgi:hypothetical protein